jgi:hypothetical protein
VKIVFVLFLVFISSTAFSSGSSWTERYISEGCGQSEREARYRASQNAVERAATYENSCSENFGLFSAAYTDCYCAPYEPGNPACSVRCNVCAVVTCDIEE